MARLIGLPSVDIEFRPGLRELLPEEVRERGLDSRCIHREFVPAQDRWYVDGDETTKEHFTLVYDAIIGTADAEED